MSDKHIESIDSRLAELAFEIEKFKEVMKNLTRMLREIEDEVAKVGETHVEPRYHGRHYRGRKIH